MCEEIKSKVLQSGRIEEADDKKELLQEGEAIAKWIDQTASQLTSDGIIQLNSRMANGTLAVLFRSNHFAVIHKRDDRLYSLVTDIGFRRTGIMWESLDQLDGDTEYLTSNFTVQSSQETYDSDLAMAMRLQFGNTSSATVNVVVPPQNVAVVGQPVRTIPKKKSKCVIM
jgi:hypothetical protein